MKLSCPIGYTGRKEYGMIKYRKQFKGTGEVIDITYEEALHTVLGSYKDNEEVRAMLTVNNVINCMFSIIHVIEE